MNGGTGLGERLQETHMFGGLESCFPGEFPVHQSIILEVNDSLNSYIVSCTFSFE